MGEPTNCIAYAYTDFVAPREGPAELWVGSSEDMTVWIDGEKVYRFEGTRKHRVPSDKQRIELGKGRHGLLVKVYQTFRAFDFSLNICEVEEDPRYAGNRVRGLKFVMPEGTGFVQFLAAKMEPTERENASRAIIAVLLSLLGAFVLVFLSSCIIWPIVSLVRRLRRRAFGVEWPTRWARVLAGLTGVLILVFLAGVIMASPGIGLKLAGDMPFLLIALLCIPLLTSGMTIGLLVFTVLAWKNRYWSLIGRLHYSLIALSALVFNPILLFAVVQIMNGRL